MKKILLLTLLSCVIFVGCEKDGESNDKPETPNFTQVEKEALQVLNGTFVFEDRINDLWLGTITVLFTAFDKPTEMELPKEARRLYHGTFNRVELSNYVTHVNTYEDDSYFILDTKEDEINTYPKDGSEYDSRGNYARKTYDYRIIGNNTIILHDQRLEGYDFDWINWDRYERQ